jgi:D-3-phosphoglycerate dehydrogenase
VPRQRLAFVSPAARGFVKGVYDEAFEGLDVQIDRAQCKSKGEIIEAVRGADVVLAAVGIDDEVIGAMDRAKAICLMSHGFESVDVTAATNAGIMVTNAAMMCNQEVANHAAAMILALNRKLGFYDRQMRAGVWDRPAGRPIGPLDGEVAGLIGLGAIGRSLARRLQAFGLHVIGYDPYVEMWVSREYAVEVVPELEQMLARSDYVSIQVPHNDETHHMMGRKQFAAMKPSAFFVNCCRGGVADELALTEALKSKKIAGAGLDVFEKEPTPKDNPLLHMDNVISSPHAAGESTRSQNDAGIIASYQAAAVLAGKWPNRVVNPEVRAKLRR